jgi:hypothetical protein
LCGVEQRTEASKAFRVVLFLWGFLMDVLAVSRLGDEEKELEILLLRQQLRIVERKQERGPHIPRWQKVPLALLAIWLKERTREGRVGPEDSLCLFRPATVVGWHRATVRRKTVYQQRRKPGRPAIEVELPGCAIGGCWAASFATTTARPPRARVPRRLIFGPYGLARMGKSHTGSSMQTTQHNEKSRCIDAG